MMPKCILLKAEHMLARATSSRQRGIEFKEYSSGKVYNSLDIQKEVAMDKMLIQQQQLKEVEWVFKGCEPSGPLRVNLESAGITIKLIP